MPASRARSAAASSETRADAMIAVSEHVARDALERFPDLEDRLETIPPGINFDRFDPAAFKSEADVEAAMPAWGSRHNAQRFGREA